MYSLEERLLAIKTYYEMGRNAKSTVRRLGYPDESNISRWIKEYEKDQNLHEHRVRYHGLVLPVSMQKKTSCGTVVVFQ